MSRRCCAININRKRDIILTAPVRPLQQPWRRDVAAALM